MTRVGEVTSCLLALPLGHSRPREIGLAGLPSIWVIFSSLTKTFCAQPTAQYGQTESTTRSASLVRGRERLAAGGHRRGAAAEPVVAAQLAQQRPARR